MQILKAEAANLIEITSFPAIVIAATQSEWDLAIFHNVFEHHREKAFALLLNYGKIFSTYKLGQKCKFC